MIRQSFYVLLYSILFTTLSAQYFTLSDESLDFGNVLVGGSYTLDLGIFSHSNDAYEDPKTLSFLKEFEKVDFIDYSKLKPTSCQWADVDWNMEDHNGHAIPQSMFYKIYR